MKKGFTLAEVLITLGIVGIVAVLTIPGVMKNYQNRMFTSQLQKVYSQISDATQAVMNDEHLDDFQETSVSRLSAMNSTTGEYTQGPAYFLDNYFKVSRKNCGKGGDKTCAKGKSDTSVYKTLNNTAIGGTDSYCVQLVSGATLCAAYNQANKCTTIAVDVNGLAQPNIAGRDVFSLDIHRNGSLSDYGSGCSDTSSGAAASECGTKAVDIHTAPSGCLSNIIEAGWKMEY